MAIFGFDNQTMTKEEKPPVHRYEAIRTLDRAAKIMKYAEAKFEDDFGGARSLRQGIEIYRDALIEQEESESQ